MNQEQEEITIDLRKVFYQIWQNKIVIILITLGFAAAGFVISAFIIKPTYRASADMLVNNKAAQVESNGVITSSDMTAASNLVDTYSVILKSHNVLEQVIIDTKTDYTYEQISKMVTVDSVGNTQVMRISVVSKDPQEAMKIVSDIVKLAPDAIIRGIDAGSVNTTDQPWTTGKPIAPSKKKWTAGAGLLGLMLCVGYILLNEILNDKFKTPDDVRTVLEYNVLGVIPVEDMDTPKKTKKTKKTGSRGN